MISNTKKMKNSYSYKLHESINSIIKRFWYILKYNPIMSVIRFNKRFKFDFLWAKIKRLKILYMV